MKIYAFLLSALICSNSVIASNNNNDDECDGAGRNAHIALSNEEREFLNSLPLENRDSTLENYEPKNESQTEALKWAKNILKVPKGQNAGLWLEGTVGLGKTHLSVGLAREYVKKGFKVFFSQNIYMLDDDFISNDVFILDDLNSLYSQGDNFKKIILHAFNEGKVVFCTSNASFESLLPQAFVADKDNYQRYRDRLKGTFKILKLTGESNRQQNSWFNDFE